MLLHDWTRILTFNFHARCLEDTPNIKNKQGCNKEKLNTYRYGLNLINMQTLGLQPNFRKKIRKKLSISTTGYVQIT